MIERWLGTFLLLGLFAGNVHAFPITLSGFFDDPTNGDLVGSDLGAALFGDDFEIANNVALFSLTVPTAGTVTFDSNGFSAGGADPYFTLFKGSGATATFLDSNFAQAFSTGGDFVQSIVLAAGDYTIALGVFANMSFAENLGVGPLADGFIALGQPGFLGNSYYELVVSAAVTPVPEPAGLLLLIAGVVGLVGMKTRTRVPARRA